MSKIYISGPITGVENYRENFKAAEVFLKKQGYKVLNPTKGEKDGFTWQYYMKRDIKKLLKCNRIYLLKGWQESKGARLEADVARAMGFTFYYE